MAYILSGEFLKEKNPTVVFTSGGENTSFPFSNVWNGITSKGFKSNSGVSPVIILHTGSIEIDSIGIYGTSGSRYDVEVEYSPNANVTSASDASWAVWNANKAGANSTGSNNIMTISADSASDLIINNTQITMQSIKLTFLNFTPLDVVNHIQIGNSTKINISAPFNPPMFKVKKQTMRKNNKGLPLGSELIDEPVKLNLRLKNLTEAEMKLLAKQEFVNELYKTPFMLATSYDLTSEDRKTAYFCTLNGAINQPTYTTPTSMEWRINALGYM